MVSASADCTSVKAQGHARQNSESIPVNSVISNQIPPLEKPPIYSRTLESRPLFEDKDVILGLNPSTIGWQTDSLGCQELETGAHGLKTRGVEPPTTFFHACSRAFK